jgi:hypothetical protein
MMNHIEAVVGLVLGVIGLITSVGGGLAWYRARVAQDVEKKRDFNHLKNNYLQMATNLEKLWVQNDERFDHIDRQLDRIEMRVDPDRTLPR